MASGADKKPAGGRAASTALVSVEFVQRRIMVIRGHKVMLDADLAEMYEVETGVLVRAVKRNLERFPDDFMFQLNADEFANLRSQSGISSSWGGRRYAPCDRCSPPTTAGDTVVRSIVEGDNDDYLIVDRASVGCR